MLLDEIWKLVDTSASKFDLFSYDVTGNPIFWYGNRKAPYVPKIDRIFNSYTF